MDIAHPTSGERRRAAPPPTSGNADVTRDGSRPPGDAVASALWDALQRAVERVGGEWEKVVEHAATPDEAMRQLDAIAGVLRGSVTGAELDASSLASSQLSRRLLRLVRIEFIREASALSPPPDPTQLLRLLGVMERVGEALEPDWAQHLSDRLSGPDGLELVVEVAHDIRSPLTSILFLAETLQRARSGPVNEVQERQLGLIYSAAFGLSSMASDVIELARGGDRLVDLEPIPFSVVDILDSVRDIVLPIAEEKGLEVRLSCPQRDFRIGHPVALSRVLLNLTTNALKFTSEGYVQVTGRDADADAVEFTVRDTGRGIPPQRMATLFEPFRRRQREGEYAFSGSGLGLSICRKLVEAMGSRLEVDTEQDKGTSFQFTLSLPVAGGEAER
ncbi:MAG TPA: HAMP domain-containing sensor histidine kinase [Gemmatimonadales bacterium]|nr:HAMP domain-containing sensor histidine kinase [Gemmatimonadales bacterium]